MSLPTASCRRVAEPKENIRRRHNLDDEKQRVQTYVCVIDGDSGAINYIQAMNSRLAPLVLLLAFAGCAFASPAPENGKFAFPGGPAFEKGAWLGSVRAYPMLLMTDASAGGEINQFLATNGSVTTVLLRYDSYQCEDENTYRIIYKGVTLPSLAQLDLCGMVQINGTNRTATMTPLSEGCPDTPYSTFQTTSGYYYFGATQFTPLPGVLPANTVTTCINSTNNVDDTEPFIPKVPVVPVPSPPIPVPPGAKAPPAPPPPPPPPKYPDLGQPKSAQPAIGMWSAPGVLKLSGTLDQGTTELKDGILLARRGGFPSYVCLSATSFATIIQDTTYYLDAYNTGITGKQQCQGGVRTGFLNNQMQLTAVDYPAPCPEALANATLLQGTQTLNLIQSLTPTTDPICRNTTFPKPPPAPPAPPAPPKPPATPGTAGGAGAATPPPPMPPPPGGWGAASSITTVIAILVTVIAGGIAVPL